MQKQWKNYTNSLCFAVFSLVMLSIYLIIRLCDGCCCNNMEAVGNEAVGNEDMVYFYLTEKMKMNKG